MTGTPRATFAACHSAGMWMIAYTGIALLTTLAGAANLSQIVALEQHEALRSPDAWLPLTAPFAGWLVARLSPRNPIAWLLLAIAVGSALFGSAALIALHRPDLPQVALDAAGWLTTWVFLPSYFISFLLLPLLYPDGRLPSPRWRPVLLAATALIVGGSILLAIGTRETLNPEVDNVWYWEAGRQFLNTVAPVIWVTMPVLALLGLAALVHRAVVAEPGERVPLAVFAATVGIGLGVLMTTGMGLALGLLLPLAVAGTVAERLHRQLQQQLATLRAQAEELQASRARISQAADTARRRIERDLHDGAQQGLLAVSVGLGRLADRVEPDLRHEVSRLKEVTQETLLGLRDLASGTYPSALRELGVGAALREAVGPDVPVSDNLGERPSETTEAAIYFAALEAVTNAGKHARASSIDVVLDRADDGAYRFLVQDDGTGVENPTQGTGMQGMSDRLAAHGGTLSVQSAPGRGTQVTGVVYETPPQGFASAVPSRAGLVHEVPR